MQTILERFKTLAESGTPTDSLISAHESEADIATAIRTYFKDRAETEADLLKNWPLVDIATAGLTAPRNPRQILADLEALCDNAQNKHFPIRQSKLRRLTYELEAVLSPLLRLLPEPL